MPGAQQILAQRPRRLGLGNVYAYSPYGETVTLGPDEGNPLQYTGRENDGTGLYYYRARYYDPGLKRFISEDPIGIIGGANICAYVNGVPTRFVDPEGKLINVVAAAIEPFHIAYAYGMAGVTLGSAAFIVGYGLGTGAKLTVEWMIGDTIGGKVADWRNPLPPLNSPVPPALTPPSVPVPTPPALPGQPASLLTPPSTPPKVPCCP